jgi:two-component system, OmpR family, response regulator
VPARPLTSIFYVDDEPDIREIVELALGLVPGLMVRTCPSGTQALQELPLVMPDLVLLDVMMPGLDGPATLAKMRDDERLRALPVVFMTAKALPQEVDRFLQMGAIGVISKPFDPIELGVRIRELWTATP